MQIDLIAVGTKMPQWVCEGFADYQARLPRDWTLNLIEIPAKKRGKNAPINAILQEEGERLLKAAAAADRIIALDRLGKSINSQQLATTCNRWHNESLRVAWLIGGPEGMSDECLQAAHEKWSLTELTLPHPLVRLVVAEQVFRAWSILHNHPYHR